LEIVHNASILKLPDAESGMLARAGMKLALMVLSAKTMLDRRMAILILIV
jgi:hypothetical protein